MMIRSLLTATVFFGILLSNSVCAQNVLFVNDSPTLQATAKDILKSYGYSVQIAGTGEEAVDKARASHPDIVIMDVVMPGMNGFKATKAITSDPQTSSIPVIFLSNKAQETDRIYGLRQGAKEYLVYDKDGPLDWTEVRDAISRQLQ